MQTFLRLLQLEPRALLYSHYGPHTNPKQALIEMMMRYPEWTAIVKMGQRYGKREEDLVGELYDRHCTAMERYDPDFLKRRIANSVHGIVVYHQRLEHAGSRA
jgi:hypothetical protein